MQFLHLLDRLLCVLTLLAMALVILSSVLARMAFHV